MFFFPPAGNLEVSQVRANTEQRPCVWHARLARRPHSSASNTSVAVTTRQSSPTDAATRCGLYRRSRRRPLRPFWLLSPDWPLRRHSHKRTLMRLKYCLSLWNSTHPLLCEQKVVPLYVCESKMSCRLWFMYRYAYQSGISTSKSNIKIINMKSSSGRCEVEEWDGENRQA